MTNDNPQSGSNQHGDSHSSAPIAEPAAKEQDEISLLDFLIIVAERKQFILRITAAFAILSIIVSLILPKSYTASVTLLPPQQNSSVGAALSSQFGAMGGLASLSGLGLKNPNDMYVAMLKSRTVEDAMVQHFGLMQEYHDKYSSDARKHFENHASVDASGKDNLIHISVQDHDPNRAAELANGYVDQFRTLSEHLAITEASQRRLFFEKQLAKAKDNLADAEEALKKTQQSTGLIQLDSQSRALIESAAQIRGQIAAREVQIQGMQTYATGENAELIQAQRELEGLRAQLAKLGGSAETTPDGFIVPKGMVPEAALEYVRKIREVKYNETIFDILARQFEIAKLDEAKEGALVQVVDPAVVPDKRSFPNRALIVIGSTLLGFLISVSVVLFQTGLGRMKDNPEANEKLIQLKQALSKKQSSAS